MESIYIKFFQSKKMNDKYLLKVKSFEDERGLLVPLESKKNIPFEIKRTYFLTNLKGNHSRGFHAHKELRQLAFCLRGSCRFVMDDGNSRQELLISNPSIGVIIDPMIWHEMHNFSDDCVLLVLASDYFHEEDYIRDYNIFKESLA